MIGSENIKAKVPFNKSSQNHLLFTDEIKYPKVSSSVNNDRTFVRIRERRNISHINQNTIGGKESI